MGLLATCGSTGLHSCLLLCSVNKDLIFFFLNNTYEVQARPHTHRYLLCSQNLIRWVSNVLTLILSRRKLGFTEDRQFG